MANKQESMAGWQEIAKAHAKAERELEIEHWFKVEIRKRKTQELLYTYDLPREMYWRWQWVIRWRVAKLTCQYPRDEVTHYLLPYDKTTGLETGFNSALGTLSAIKAHITKLNNEIAEYIESQQGQLFFNPETDPVLQRAYEKLRRQEERRERQEGIVKNMVEQLNNKKQ